MPHFLNSHVAGLNVQIDLVLRFSVVREGTYFFEVRAGDDLLDRGPQVGIDLKHLP